METEVMNNVVEEVKEEVVPAVVNNGGMLKGMTIGSGLAVAGYAAYQLGKKLIKKHKAKKARIEQPVIERDDDIYDEVDE